MSGSGLPFPVYVVHCKRHVERKTYLDENFSRANVIPEYITEFDAGEFDIGTVYRFDEERWRSLISEIRSVVVGYALGSTVMKNLPFANCVAMRERHGYTLEQDIENIKWLRPRMLGAGEISCFLKHRESWKRIAAGPQEWGIVVEDDLIFAENSVDALRDLCGRLPSDADYIDFAGGLSRLPRIGNRVVNENFLLMEPPCDRTACGIMLKQSFAEMLLSLDIPLALPLDWTLTWASNRVGAHVYWVHPLIFGHGSALGEYASTTIGREQRHALAAALPG